VFTWTVQNPGQVPALDWSSVFAPTRCQRSSPSAMDFQLDSYAQYSDASTPRTPSPRTSVSSDDIHYPSPGFKPIVDVAVAPALYEHNDEHGIVPEPHAIKAAAYMHSQHYHNASYPPPPSSRGSLLDELYDQEMPESNIPNELYQSHDSYHHQQPHHHSHSRHHGWTLPPQSAHGEHLPPVRHLHDIPMGRRATFPMVRHEGRESLPYPPPPFMTESPNPYGSRPGTMYGDPLPMDAMHHHMDEPFAHNVGLAASPHAPLYDMIKTEDSPVIVPSQTGYCRPPSAGMHGLPCLSPHAGLLVQHTDDAASKETQYLRRRCFNCHTTEPPSWRRSTLNPGKIVCNKCGLYERTHLRPRPLRFDELRAGSKTRKQPKGAVNGSPKVGKLSPVVKKESRDSAEPLQRRSSVSSSNGSAPSVTGATSDWDDSSKFNCRYLSNVELIRVSVSLASSGSLPSSSFNSPAVSTFSIPRDSASQSPPRDGGIRLPNAPLSDIASLTSSPEQRPTSASGLSPPTPRKPGDYYGTDAEQDMYSRHDVLSQPSMPEVTGWQSVPLSDLAPSKSKSRSNSLRKSVVAV
jgi:GATA-binding protein, other eukaryote